MQHAITEADRYRDAELYQLLAVVVDSDRGESPFGWSDPAPRPEAEAPR
jgi:hypothetical protein